MTLLRQCKIIPSRFSLFAKPRYLSGSVATYMMDMEDSELLREFSERGSDPAFTTLVERYADLVYSTALRQFRDPHLSQEHAYDENRGMRNNMTRSEAIAFAHAVRDVDQRAYNRFVAKLVEHDPSLAEALKPAE